MENRKFKISLPFSPLAGSVDVDGFVENNNGEELWRSRGYSSVTCISLT
ncbi:MAG TPA: hypothetical protein VMT76_15825 [Puia sp.]|nr:hypothetical protein [Puia sp.]